MIRYIIISPVRDEEADLEKTIESVVTQTVRPAEWIIVDDGSTDTTAEIADKHAKVHSWIKVVHRENRGFRRAGGGVVEAFYDGYNILTCADWDYAVKLDGDLSFQPDYFEQCFKRFTAEPKLGIGGGMIYNALDGGLQWEPHPMFHVRGATKIYRRECWDATGGLINASGWDTLDEVKANMLGWQTVTFADLQVIHHRVTGSADGTWRDAVKNGTSDYICGYHPIFAFVKYARRTFRKPYLVGALGHIYGFVAGYAKGIRQVEDKALISYLRNEQLKKLFLRPSIWT